MIGRNIETILIKYKFTSIPATSTRQQILEEVSFPMTLIMSVSSRSFRASRKDTREASSQSTGTRLLPQRAGDPTYTIRKSSHHNEEDEGRANAREMQRNRASRTAVFGHGLGAGDQSRPPPVPDRQVLCLYR